VNYHTYYQGGELVVAGRTADKEVQEISGDVSAAAKGIDTKKYAVKVRSIPDINREKRIRLTKLPLLLNTICQPHFWFAQLEINLKHPQCAKISVKVLKLVAIKGKIRVISPVCQRNL